MAGGRIGGGAGSRVGGGDGRMIGYEVVLGIVG